MKYSSKLKEYFKNFSNKNLFELEKMFSENIVLRDWNIHALGKQEVIDANKGIFESVETIQVTPVSFYSNSDYSYAVCISILINGNETLDVIDVIDFDNDGLIKSVVAFKYED